MVLEMADTFRVSKATIYYPFFQGLPSDDNSSVHVSEITYAWGDDKPQADPFSMLVLIYYVLSGNSVRIVLHMTDLTPMMWYLKNQTTSETVKY